MRWSASGIWHEWIATWVISRFLCWLSLLTLAAYFLRQLDPPRGLAVIHSDGAGYYAYLPSYLLYRDPSFETDAKLRYGGEFPSWTYVKRWPETGRYLVMYSYGVALMMLPFFLVGHVLTWLFRAPAGAPETLHMQYALDGYSFFYQHAAGLAGVFYFLIGVALLKRALDREFGDGITVATLLALIFGTNLFYYGTFENVLAHAYTFCLAAWLVELAPRLATSSSVTLPDALKAGVIFGLLYLVRPPNVVYGLVPAFYGVTSWQSLRDRFLWAKRNAKHLLVAGSAFFVLVLPQMLIWKYATGRFLVNPYGEAARFEAPDLVGVLFALEKGAFFWFPIFFVSLLGFIALWLRARQWFWAVSLPYAILIMVVACYTRRFQADGFGNRYVVDWVVLQAMPLGALYSTMRSRMGKAVVALLSVGCVSFTLFLLKLFLTLEIPGEGLDPARWYDILWWRKEALFAMLRALFDH